MARISSTQLTYRLGGSHVLVELLDKDGDGTADSSLVSRVLDDSEGEINSAISLAWDLSDTRIDTAPIVITKQLDIAAWRAYNIGTHGQGIPPDIQNAYQEAKEWMGLVAQRLRGLGLTARPTAAQPVQQITKSDTDDFFNYDGPRGRFAGWS